MRPAKPEMVNRAKKMPTGMRFVMGSGRFVMESGRFPSARRAEKAGIVPSGLVARDERLVDLVDLLGVEELARVAQVHPVADEDVEEVRVDVAVLLEPAEDAERFGEGLAGLVGAVLGR